LNLAAPLGDGAWIYVPRRGELTPPPTVGPDAGLPVADGSARSSGGASGSAAPALININVASAEELETLPGVGPATAAAILDHRTRHGPFRTVDDLTKVRGIGPAKLDQVRALVTV
jgi:competence protein ComEA